MGVSWLLVDLTGRHVVSTRWLLMQKLIFSINCPLSWFPRAIWTEKVSVLVFSLAVNESEIALNSPWNLFQNGFGNIIVCCL